MLKSRTVLWLSSGMAVSLDAGRPLDPRGSCVRGPRDRVSAKGRFQSWLGMVLRPPKAGMAVSLEGCRPLTQGDAQWQLYGVLGPGISVFVVE